MTTPIRRDLFRLLAHLCEVFPSMRFGQLVSNLAGFVEMTPEAVWTIEDQPLLAMAEELLKGQVERLDLGGPPPLTDQIRLDLIAAIQEYGERFPDVPTGRLIADLVALFKEPTSVQDWAGTIWDVEDQDLLDTVRTRLAHRSTSSDYPTATFALREPHAPRI
jgi:hypothetical protein